MKIQCNEKFWNKVANHCDGDNEPMLTWDERAKVTAFQNEDGKRFEFESTSCCMDPIDMPVTVRVPVGDDVYFDTEEFKIIPPPEPYNKKPRVRITLEEGVEEIKENPTEDSLMKTFIQFLKDSPDMLREMDCSEELISRLDELEWNPNDPEYANLGKIIGKTFEEVIMGIPTFESTQMIKDTLKKYEEMNAIENRDGDIIQDVQLVGKYLKVTFSTGKVLMKDISKFLADAEDDFIEFDNCPQEKAVKLIGSLNNDLRRLFKDKIEEDLHVSINDRLVDTLNKVLTVGKELREQQKPIIDRIISAVADYNIGLYGPMENMAKEKLAKRIVNLMFKAGVPEYLDIEKGKNEATIKLTLIKALTMSEIKNNEIIANNTQAEN